MQLSDEGILQINCETNRSQLKNKEICIRRFNKLLAEALIQPKKRKSTKPSKSAIRKRLREKKKRSEIKKTVKQTFKLLAVLNKLSIPNLKLMPGQISSVSPLKQGE